MLYIKYHIWKLYNNILRYSCEHIEVVKKIKLLLLSQVPTSTQYCNQNYLYLSTKHSIR